jgi:hypothetical protein
MSDPLAPKLVANLKPGGDGEIHRVVLAGGLVWLAHQGDSAVYAYDPNDLTAPKVAFGKEQGFNTTHGMTLRPGTDELWVTNRPPRLPGYVIRIDARTRSIVGKPILTTGVPGDQPNNVAFTPAETGQSLGGEFLRFWRANGGLAVLGYPLEAEQQLDDLIVQWTERARFELHPENPAPYNVLLGRLGVEALDRRGLDWRALPSVAAAPSGCHYVAATRHSLCGEFLRYWQSHGLEFDGSPGTSDAESLALFGQPISEPQMEQGADGKLYLTQWFERARFELHPENAEPYRVLLGRLGAEQLATP